jgi:DNA polymerase-4
MNWLCRDCMTVGDTSPGRCPHCASPRLVFHEELGTLALAHIDCDAFYASIEKRDRPELIDRPVIVGGGTRGVVTTCCYVARLYGVRSAMPMFKALKACPEAVVIRPDMAKYRRVGLEVRELMRATTPLVEAVSIDEAYLDLAGTQRLHGGPPAVTLARLAHRIEAEVGITVSIGLSATKFLAKVASDLDKPRGFRVIGAAEASGFLAGRPASMIPGVGRSLSDRLTRDGIRLIGQLQAMDEAELVKRYGAMGQRLARFAWGRDPRRVDPAAPTKSVSAETTFDVDIADRDRLLAELWPLCERVARRLKQAEFAGAGVTLKLKTGDFRLRTRSTQLTAPTQLAETLFRASRPLLEREADGTSFRLIGIGASGLVTSAAADPLDLIDPDAAKRARIERTIDQVRAKLGDGAILKGRGLPTVASRKPRIP